MKKFISDFHLIYKGFKEIHSLCPKLLAFYAIKSILVALSPFLNIYMSTYILNAMVLKQSLEKLLMLAFLTVIFNLIVALLISMFQHLINIRQAEFESRYKMRLNYKIISLDYVDIENPETHRLRQKVDEVRNMNGGGIWMLISSFQKIIQNMFTIVFSIILTVSLFITPVVKGEGFAWFISSPWFSIIIVIGILLNIFINMYTSSSATKKMYSIMSDIIPFNRIFGYYLGNYISCYHAGKDIRIYNQKELIKRESMALFDDVNQTLNKLSQNQVKHSMLASFSTILLSTVIYLYVGLKALIGIFGASKIVQYIGSINQFTDGFTSLMTQLVVLRSNNEAMKVYFDFMEIPSKMYKGTHTINRNINDRYQIEFINVSFQYPGTKKYVLKNINLKFSYNQRIAIVGMNGSGKTTLIKLLCRLYDPTEGVITLNGIDIKRYAYHDYIDLFSVVFQDFKLFSFLLGQNIAASTDVEESRAVQALEKAGLKKRFLSLSQGLNTPLYKDFEENGIELSGGEGQKIAFARALYKNAPFIILDEPTAALDPIAENELFTQFNKNVKDKTTIFISHRLSSCRFCDEIVVFHEGKIIQQGRHNELIIDKKGKYYELWNAQAQNYIDDVICEQ